MKIPNLVSFKGAARWGRHAVWDVGLSLTRLVRRPAPGEFQPYTYTRTDRYPWLFGFAAEHIGPRENLRILSFGCSRGEEVFSLRRYFPAANIKGIDINARNIARCQARARAIGFANGTFELAATTAGEASGSYDAIFCLAVLLNGDLTTSKAQRSDPLLRFETFDRLIGDFARCLKPGGLLVLHTTNFRFCDTAVAAHFNVVCEADPKHLAPDVLFDRNNQLMSGERERYRAVAFQKL
ncbi:MAG TPA: class I SAM-dependent methyltransferase [Steroidobacteraceae bacterium]|jgi:SAM-dependent methyltransferase|nr:class I SAM-dependent methyltransferase [Steroidobacteraceae bacterium]